MIVISHVTQTLYSENGNVGFQDYVYLLGNVTNNIQEIILILLNPIGALGNNIFFICSAYFLIGKEKPGRKKAFTLLCSVWAISVLYLIVYAILQPSVISGWTIKISLLPTLYENNWYMTCYIIFLLIYPLLNKLIANIDQKQLLRIVLFSSCLWILADYFLHVSPYWSQLAVWITIYFLMAYLKLYVAAAMKNIKVGAILLAVGIFGYIMQIVAVNFAGLYVIKRWSNNVLYFAGMNSPFYIMIAIGALIIALNAKFKSSVINYISGLSMFVYLIHENYLFRNYTRPAIWQHLYVNFGYDHIVLLDLGLALALFVASVIVSAVYKGTIQKVVARVADKLYKRISMLYGKVEQGILNRVKR